MGNAFGQCDLINGSLGYSNLQIPCHIHHIKMAFCLGLNTAAKANLVCLSKKAEEIGLQLMSVDHKLF
jgi:hypothetical protein